ncbi:ribulose-bisphosphate carboxylase [cyanobacterium endosymbiont of Rhopalodia gibberula]|nr:ribulose-bisphosphate carboxylase [cyanobacterium endosymbiont of Rhopalodia gibberula]
MEISPKECCYETLSYLPSLTDQQIIKQIANVLDQGVTPKVESEEIPDITTYFWTMWKLPLFSASSVQKILAEVRECCSEYPNSYICVIHSLTISNNVKL